MLPIRWRADAEADLASILGYIAERSPQAANKLYDDVQRPVSGIPLNPYLYRVGRVSGTHELVVHPNYIVVCRVTSSEIEVVSFVHARRQYPSH